MADASTFLAAEADDHFHYECGVFGILGRQDAAADLGAGELGCQAPPGGAIRGRLLEVLGRVGIVDTVETERSREIALGHDPG